MRIFADPQLVTAPIGSAVNYTWTALSANWKNSAIVASVLLLLSLLGMLPLLGLLASIAQGILLYAIAYWIVDKIRQSDSLERFKSVVAGEPVKNLLTGYLSPAAGFYVGFMLFSVLLAVITLFILWISGSFATMGAVMQQAGGHPTQEQMAALYAQLIVAGSPGWIFILLSSLFFGYLWPLVYGYALMQRTFSDAFNAVFMFFSTAFWRASFTGAYFRLISLWMLILLGVGILTIVCLALIVLLPAAILLSMWMVYFTAVVSAEAYNFSEGI